MGIFNIINAVRNNNPIELQKELYFCKISIKQDFDLNQATMGKKGQSLLHFAIKQGNERIFLLLAPYIDINITDDDGNTPAHYAVMFEQTQILKFLKAAGADFAKKNNFGLTLDKYLQISPQRESKRIKIELENILLGSPDLPMQTDITLNTSKKIYTHPSQPNDSSFFHNLPKAFEFPIEPINLIKHDKPLNLSITP